MGEIRVVMDGREVRAREGTTILAAAEKAGVAIPTLCHRPDLRPSGNCRICVVEVVGFPRLVASCHTPIAEGMVVQTKSPKVVTTRRVNFELLITAHTGPCVMDTAARECELHNLAAKLEVGVPRFRVRASRSYPVEGVSPYVRRDMSRCILCRRCVRACSEIAKKDIYSMAYRGFRSKVVVDWDVTSDKEACKDCGVCIDYCPTTALKKPEKGVA